MTADVGRNVQAHRDNWYRLMCGADVPHTFLQMHLDAPTHFARGEVPATQHLRKSLQVYQQLLNMTGRFLCGVVQATSDRLEDGELREMTAPQHQPRITINHSAREQLALHQYQQ